MTSSFRRQPQNTNYLSTEADLSGAVNKEIDANIKDTQAFYDQMVELEKLRYQNRDNNLKALTQFAQQAGKIYQKVKEANEFRETYTPTSDLWQESKDLLDQQNRIDDEQRSIRNEEKKIAAQAGADANDPNNTQEERETASDAQYALMSGGFSYNDDLNSKNNIKDFSGQLLSLLQVASKDNSFEVLDKRILNDNTTHADARAHIRELTIIAMQHFIRERRAAGGRELTLSEIRKYLGPSLKNAENNLIKLWSSDRASILAKQVDFRTNQEIQAMVKNPETMAQDMLGKEGWITNRKEELEAAGYSSSFASLRSFQEFSEKLIPMFTDVESGVNAAVGETILSTIFQFNGSKGTLDSKAAPKGAKTLADNIRGAIKQFNTNAAEQEIENKKLEIDSWGNNEHKEFLATNPSFLETKQYTLDFKKRFRIKNEEELPDFIKNMISSNYFPDEQIIIDITGRRIKNLPITEAMINRIQDPNKRATQMKYVNTPELGAFTEEEAESMDERVVAIVKEAKQLRDLNQAKTDQYIVTRDNTKEYITARFKELVVGGQPRKTAMYNAIKEAKAFVKDGTFDKEEILPIDVQATKDLQATMTAIQGDPNLIYSSEDFAGETPHLDIAAEYRRTGGRSKYPSYYLRFNFIKDSDGAYLTPEEVIDTRLEKTGRMKDGKIIKLPEREKLDNVEDQNKLLNKNNSTKTLDVALKNNNIEWMTSQPSLNNIDAEAFVRKLELNIQNQQFITGIGQTHRTKTTLSSEDNNKLFEAVPELKEAPFLNPNTLSTEAINEMLNLNI